MASTVRPLITIAIPTYNRADSYLRGAIKSALDQTYPNIEVIVSDNCSTDQTEMIVKNFTDARVRYFRQARNIGPNKNFNFCVEQACGEYFLLLQDDDLIDPDFVQVCMEAAGYRTGIGIIRTGTRIIDAGGNILRELPNRAVGLSTIDFFLAWFSYQTSPYLCSTLLNTRRLREMGGFKSKNNLFQDVVAEFRLAHEFGRVDIQDLKASFRKHPSENTFAVKVKDWCEDSLYLLDVMCELEPEHDALLRSAGKRFFFHLNYNKAQVIRSPVQRFMAYLTVFEKFDYPYSPIPFLIDKNPRMRRIKLLIKTEVEHVLARLGAWRSERIA